MPDSMFSISLTDGSPLATIKRLGFQVQPDAPSQNYGLVVEAVERIRDRTIKFLEQAGFEIVSPTTGEPVLHLAISVRQERECVTGVEFFLYRIELILREWVFPLRNPEQKYIADTWRTKAAIGYVAVSMGFRSLEAAILGEIERQRNTFEKSLRGVSNPGPKISHGDVSVASTADETVSLSNNRVAKAKDLLAAGKVYDKGCSGFIAEVLGVAWEEANVIMGDSPTYVGDNNSYPGLVPGDIVGWKVGGGQGHVAVYIGEAEVKFIDVRNPGAKPRKVVHGYGNGQSVFKSNRY